MRATILILTFVSFMISGVSVMAFETKNSTYNLNSGEKKTETVKVYGNCGMCETTIEKAAKS